MIFITFVVYLFVKRSPTFLVTAFSTKDKDIKRISRLGHPRSESFYITPVKTVTHCTKNCTITHCTNCTRTITHGSWKWVLTQILSKSRLFMYAKHRFHTHIINNAKALFSLWTACKIYNWSNLTNIPHKLSSCRCKILLPTAAPSDLLAFAAADCVSVPRVWYLVCKSTIRTPPSSPGHYVLSTQQHAYSEASLGNRGQLLTLLTTIGHVWS